MREVAANHEKNTIDVPVQTAQNPISTFEDNDIVATEPIIQGGAAVHDNIAPATQGDSSAVNTVDVPVSPAEPAANFAEQDPIVNTADVSASQAHPDANMVAVNTEEAPASQENPAAVVEEHDATTNTANVPVSPAEPDTVVEAHDSPAEPDTVVEAHDTPAEPDTVVEAHASPAEPDTVVEAHDTTGDTADVTASEAYPAAVVEGHVTTVNTADVTAAQAQPGAVAEEHDTTAIIDNAVSASVGAGEYGTNFQDSAFILLAPSSTSTAPSLPTWMTDYFSWHREQLLTLTDENWRSHKFLVSRCLDMDRACGGASDRLKSLPTLLLLAAESRRLLMFEWSRPAPMQAYLVPTHNLNWTVPSFVPVKGLGTRLFTKLPTLISGANSTSSNNNVPVVCARVQDSHSVAQYYNEHPWNPATGDQSDPFRRDFRLLFFTIMAPSPSVAQQYQKEAQALFLNAAASTTVPNYNVAHVRVRYGNSPVPATQVEALAQNAVNCASRLGDDNEGQQQQQPPPILVISDAARVLEGVPHYGKNNNSNIVVSTQPHRGDRPAEPLHLDKDLGASADAYTDTFVDLMHMANARCTSHGLGGFGRFGVLLSRDPSCFFAYIDQGQFHECQWKESGV